MTIQELISLIDNMYPSATTDATKVIYMNRGQDILSEQFGLIVTDSSLETIAGTDEYTFPTGIEDISQVETFDIANRVPTLEQPLNRYEYIRYKIGFSDDSPMLGNCIYQIYSSVGVKSLVIHPAPSMSDLPIVIRYHAKLATLSVTELTKSPEFDSRYHSLLALFACYQICANGSSPDSIQANRFSAEFQEGFSQIQKHDYAQKIIAPKKPRDNRIWHRG